MCAMGVTNVDPKSEDWRQEKGGSAVGIAAYMMVIEPKNIRIGIYCSGCALVCGHAMGQ